MSDHCCEDEKGNALCRELIGVFCTAVRGTDGYVHNFEVTKGGIEMLRHVGCPKFRERESRVGLPKKDKCETCKRSENCEFKRDMNGGERCSKYDPMGGLLNQDAWV